MSSGGSNTTTSRTEPYAPAEPFLQDILGEAQNIYRSGVGRQFFPGSTVVPFADQTQQALNLQQAAALEAAAPSALDQQAANVFSQFASTPQTNQYLSDIRSGITSDVLGNIQTQFGGMGRTGTSPAAQAAATRAFTQAYSPFAISQAEAERRAEQTAIENQIGRQLTAAQGLTGLQGDIDARKSEGIDRILDVGARQEDLAARNLQEQIDRFTFGQTMPFQRLNQFADYIYPAARFSMPQMQYGSSPSPLTSAYGGGTMGYTLGSMFPSFGGPAGAALGIGAGLLGL